MKTHLLLVGALYAAVLLCDHEFSRVANSLAATPDVANLNAAKPTKQPAPTTAPAPPPAPDGKQRKSRPMPPAHLFM